MNTVAVDKKRAHLSVYLPDDVFQQVEVLAGETERSLSRMVALLVKEALARRTSPVRGTAPATSMISEALSLAGALAPPVKIPAPKVKPKETSGG